MTANRRGSDNEVVLDGLASAGPTDAEALIEGSMTVWRNLSFK